MVLFYFGSFPCLLSDYFLGICCGQAFAWNVLQIIPSSPFPPGAHCVLWEKRLLYFIKFTHFWSKMLGQFRRWNNIWWKLTELIFVKGFWSMILSILQHWYPSCLCLLETKADYVVHLSRGFPLKKTRLITIKKYFKHHQGAEHAIQMRNVEVHTFSRCFLSVWSYLYCISV